MAGEELVRVSVWVHLLQRTLHEWHIRGSMIDQLTITELKVDRGSHSGVPQKDITFDDSTVG